MADLLKIAAVFITILVLLRLKWNIGYVLLIASGLLAALYLMSPQKIGLTALQTVTDSVTIKFFLALTLIRILEMILREKQVMARMMEASRDFLRKKKAVIISMPLLIGMLPSLGGAYFSAPMVDESTKGLKMSQEEKGFINYWYRHPWEYILPLYPGILLAAAVANVELRNLILANLPYAILILITGFLFSMRNVHGSCRTPGAEDALCEEVKDSDKKTRLRALLNFLPIAFVLLLVMVFHVELHTTLAVTIVVLYVFYRFSIKEVFRTLRYGFAWDVIVLIIGTMFFKFMMDNSGAVTRLSASFYEAGIPPLLVLFALPFISGLITGITVGFVGSTFPLIISFTGGAHLNEISLAFASGFMGVLLSPVHLCLVLTREYFKADMWGMYKKIIPAALIILAAALAQYFIL